MGKVCSSQGENEKCMKDFAEKARRKGTTRKTLKWILDI
jgi:hypothetical protein